MNTSVQRAGHQLHAMGANVNAIEKGSKKPLHTWKHWYDTRQTEADVKRLPWYKAAGVGVINGPGGWRTFDVDPKKEDELGNKLSPDTIAPVPATVRADVVRALGLPDDYRWVYRSGSGKGWEIAFICDDDLPAGVLSAKDDEPGVFWGVPKDGTSFGHIELRWEHCQTIYPPSAYCTTDGPGYQWYGDPPDTPPARVSVGHVLNAFFAVAKPKHAEPKHQPTPKPKPQTTSSRPASEREAINEIKRRFPLVRYALKHWPGETRQERNGEIRILGYGGFLIDEEKRVWDRFDEGRGGDAIELVGYRLYDDRWDHDDGTMFRAALEEAAQEAGVELPAVPRQVGGVERTEQGGYVFTISDVAPLQADDDVVTLRRRDYELLQARAAHAEYLEEWRAWALTMAKIESRDLSPAAKVVAFTLRPEMEYQRDSGTNEPRRVWIEKECKKAGVSAGTYGDKLKELENAGALTRIEDRQANGHKKVLVQPTEFFSLPEAWKPATPRQHGGSRPGAGRPAPDCPKCGADAPIVEKQTITSRYFCGTCEAPLGPSEPRHRTRTWKANNQLDCWQSDEESEAEANTQLAPTGEDGSSPPITQVDGWLETSPSEPNNQVDCWPPGEACSSPSPAPAQAGAPTDNRNSHTATITGNGTPAGPAPPAIPPLDPLTLPGVVRGAIAPDDPWIRDGFAAQALRHRGGP